MLALAHVYMDVTSAFIIISLVLINWTLPHASSALSVTNTIQVYMYCLCILEQGRKSHIEPEQNWHRLAIGAMQVQ